MPTIPAKPASLRVKVWRRLQSIGAVTLRGAVYVLPNRDECVELFEWIGEELRELGGQLSLCEGRFLDEAADRDIEARFTEARNADYAEVAGVAKQVLMKLRGKRITPARLARDARCGALFVFFGKRLSALKVLFFDGTGLCMFYKRLDQRDVPDPAGARGHAGADDRGARARRTTRRDRSRDPPVTARRRTMTINQRQILSFGSRQRDRDIELSELGPTGDRGAGRGAQRTEVIERTCGFCIQSATRRRRR